jgi:hypothetical protein
MKLKKKETSFPDWAPFVTIALKLTLLPHNTTTAGVLRLVNFWVSACFWQDTVLSQLLK